jgi:hypothetical protein
MREDALLYAYRKVPIPRRALRELEEERKRPGPPPRTHRACAGPRCLTMIPVGNRTLCHFCRFGARTI